MRSMRSSYWNLRYNIGTHNPTELDGEFGAKFE